MPYNGMCSSFFLDLATADHDFDNDTFMLALYEDRNIMSPNLQEYTSAGEAVGVNYPAGGIEVMVKVGWPKQELALNPQSGRIEGYDMAVRFDDLTFINLSASVGAALIYNGRNNRAIRCIDFGDVQLVVTSDFHIRFPSDAEPPIYIKMLR